MKKVDIKIRLIDFLAEIAEIGETRGDRAPFFDALNQVNQGSPIFQNPAILASKSYRLYRNIGCNDDIATANAKLLSEQLQEYKAVVNFKHLVS